MGLESIKKEIEQKAASVEKEILLKAQQQVKEIQKKAAMEIHDIEQQEQKRFDMEIALLLARELSMANMEAKKRLFEVRKRQISEVYEQAQKRIESMPQSERASMLAQQLEKAKKQIAVDVVYVNNADSALINGVRTKESSHQGGIICENADGTIRVDYSFATLFDQTREKTLAEVSRILFE